LLRLVIEVQYAGALPMDTQEMDASTILKDPAGRRVLAELARLIGEGGGRVLESLAATILQGGIDQQADGPDHKQRHDPLRLLARERGGQKPWIFQEPKATFRMPLAFLPREQFQGW